MTALDLLAAEPTKIIYRGGLKPDGSLGDVFNLAGISAGTEGVNLASGFKWPFTPHKLLSSEGASQDGATFIRSVRGVMLLELPIAIQADTLPQFYARNDRFWRNWNSDIPGHMSWWTRYAGWQTLRLQTTDEPEPLTGVDPTADYFEAFTLSATAMLPFFLGLDEESVWSNAQGLNEGALRLRNYTDRKGYPRYTMNGPGRFYIEDPDSDDTDLRQVQTPVLLANEELRINTHPRRPTARLYSPATGENGRNVWGQLQGRRWLFPLQPWSSTEIRVRVEGGSTASKVIGVVTPRKSRPF